jgi:hypothetical protein
MLDQIKAPIALFAGTWIATRAIRIGITYLIPQNPAPHTLQEKVKKTYELFLECKDEEVRKARVFLGDIHDFLPLSLTLTLMQCPFHYHIELEHIPEIVTATIAYSLMIKICWLYLIYKPVQYLAAQPAMARYATSVVPWAQPTAYADYGTPPAKTS